MSRKQSDDTLKYLNKDDEIGNSEKKIKIKTILNLSKKGYTIIKCMIFFLAIGVLFMGRAFGVPKDEYTIINDPVMYDWLEGMNTKINDNQEAAKILQISSSLFMDLSFFMMFGYWVVKINTGRLLYATAAFYVIRNIVQRFVVFPFPQGYYWDDPGFPTLTVPYGRSSDFFWSGHCGFLMVLGCEWFTQKKYQMFIITCLINFYMAIVMIGFRIHYTVDIIIGVMIAHYVFMLFTKAAPYIDEWVKFAFNYIWNKISDNNKDDSKKEELNLQSQNNLFSIQQQAQSNAVALEENKL